MLEHSHNVVHDYPKLGILLADDGRIIFIDLDSLYVVEAGKEARCRRLTIADFTYTSSIIKCVRMKMNSLILFYFIHRIRYGSLELVLPVQSYTIPRRRQIHFTIPRPGFSMNNT